LCHYIAAIFWAKSITSLAFKPAVPPSKDDMIALVALTASKAAPIAPATNKPV
jgi:hypothetical protein